MLLDFFPMMHEILQGDASGRVHRHVYACDSTLTRDHEANKEEYQPLRFPISRQANTSSQPLGVFSRVQMMKNFKTALATTWLFHNPTNCLEMEASLLIVRYMGPSSKPFGRRVTFSLKIRLFSVLCAKGVRLRLDKQGLHVRLLFHRVSSKLNPAGKPSSSSRVEKTISIVSDF